MKKFLAPEFYMLREIAHSKDHVSCIVQPFQSTLLCPQLCTILDLVVNFLRYFQTPMRLFFDELTMQIWRVTKFDLFSPQFSKHDKNHVIVRGIAFQYEYSE